MRFGGNGGPQRSLIGCFFSDGVISNNEEQSLNSAVGTWSSPGNRDFVLPIDCNISRFTISISVNLNTGPGATVGSHVGPGSGNITIALGTGTGTFQDLVNSDSVLSESVYAWKYFNFDSTIGGSVGCVSAVITI